MLWLPRWLGKRLATFLTKERDSARTGTPVDAWRLAHCLQPGDVLLLEGSSRISTAIKYLTQSTWSHAAMYVGPSLGGHTEDGEPYLFIEADLVEGVCKKTLSYYVRFHTRICRARNLSAEDLALVLHSVQSKLGNQYDLKNVLDLARYLFPLPVPTRWRRKMIAFGSGDPTKAICSSLLAEAFQSVRYPILPIITQRRCEDKLQQDAVQEIYEIRHESLYAPRDFDVSPYFEVIKPTLECGFNYQTLRWAGDEATPPVNDIPET